MRVIIMGCGRVGEQAARLMVDEGHSVTVIDTDEASLEHLGADFKGNKIRGVGFDRDVLMQAGIKQADAFAATSNSDNANIVAARIARNVYRVPRVVARLYDPRRAEIYRRLGLLTFSSTILGAERVRELLSFPDLDPLMSFGGGEVVVATLEIPSNLEGRQVRDLNVAGEVSVMAITRQGQAYVPLLGTEFHSGDLIHLVILTAAMNRFKMMLGFGEGE